MIAFSEGRTDFDTGVHVQSSHTAIFAVVLSAVRARSGFQGLSKHLLLHSSGRVATATAILRNGRVLSAS